jgi:DNA-binding response OmpR family regulator
MPGRSLLIIDNDRDLVDLLAFYFEEHGYAVETAIDGHTGVALAQLRKPDVVICDIVMDRMHGFEVIQKLRGRPELAGMTIIMLSAKAHKSDIDRARALGADHFLVKPFRCDDLLRTVEAGAAVTAPSPLTASSA